MNPWFCGEEPEDLARRVEAFAAAAAPLIVETRARAAGDGLYGLWLLAADTALRAATGLNVGVLGWARWREAYDDGSLPAAAAEQALRESRFGFLIMPAQQAAQEANSDSAQVTGRACETDTGSEW